MSDDDLICQLDSEICLLVDGNTAIEKENALLKEKLAIAETALEWYAKQAHWDQSLDPNWEGKPSATDMDSGARARQALAQIRGGR